MDRELSKSSDDKLLELYSYSDELLELATKLRGLLDEWVSEGYSDDYFSEFFGYATHGAKLTRKLLIVMPEYLKMREDDRINN